MLMLQFFNVIVTVLIRSRTIIKKAFEMPRLESLETIVFRSL